MGTKKKPEIPLPKGWRRHVRSAILHVICLAQYATVYTRSWAVDSINGRVRLRAENDRLLQELELQREERRMKSTIASDLPIGSRDSNPASVGHAARHVPGHRPWLRAAG